MALRSWSHRLHTRAALPRVQPTWPEGTSPGAPSVWPLQQEPRAGPPVMWASRKETQGRAGQLEEEVTQDTGGGDPGPKQALSSAVLCSDLSFDFRCFSGGKKSPPSNTKEAPQREIPHHERKVPGPARQTAPRGPEAAAGCQESGLLPTELRHGARRQHRDLHPRGPDPALRTQPPRGCLTECLYSPLPTGQLVSHLLH